MKSTTKIPGVRQKYGAMWTNILENHKNKINIKDKVDPMINEQQVYSRYIASKYGLNSPYLWMRET